MSTVSSARSGFVRVPRAWVALDVSPGARVLLFHFCAAANAVGESWYKFAQLSEIVGRSKPAISGYLDELRDAGVVETEQQRTANGYRAHLLVRLVGWAALLGEWSAMADAARRRASRSEGRASSAARPHAADPRAESRATPRNSTWPGVTSCSSDDEHRVQDAEHNHPSDDNKNHDTNARPNAAIKTSITNDAIGESWSQEDERRWKYYRDGVAGLGFERQPPTDLLDRAIRHAEAVERAIGWCDEGAAQVHAAAELRSFAKNMRIALGDDLDSVVAIIVKRARTPGAITRAVGALREVWSPHWRHLSTPEQMAALLDSDRVKKLILGDAERAAHRARARASLARLELRRRREDGASNASAAVTSLAARTVADSARRGDTAFEGSANGPVSRREIGRTRHGLEIGVSR